MRLKWGLPHLWKGHIILRWSQHFREKRPIFLSLVSPVTVSSSCLILANCFRHRRGRLSFYPYFFLPLIFKDTSSSNFVGTYISVSQSGFSGTLFPAAYSMKKVLKDKYIQEMLQTFSWWFTVYYHIKSSKKSWGKKNKTSSTFYNLVFPKLLWS